MILHDPFIISARLCPAIRLGGGATLSYTGCQWREAEPGFEKWVPRQGASFVIDFPDGTSYEDDRMSSGMGGFQGIVSMFENFVGFLSAAVESYEHGLRNRCKGENTDLFPLHIVKWASEEGRIDEAECDLRDEDGNTREGLIEEAA